MKNILAFCFHPSFTPPGNGGEARLFHFYSALSNHFRVTLISSTHGGTQEETVQHGIRFTERRIPKDEAFVRQWQALEPLGSGGDLSGPCIAASAGTHGAIHDAYLQEYQDADIVIHDSPFMVGYDLFLGADNKPRIYNAYNCESSLYATLHPATYSAPIHNIVCEAERRLLQQADLLFYCNPDDIEALALMVPSARYRPVYTPHGAFTQIAPTDHVPTDSSNVIFLGSSHPPNVEAARYIAETLAPRLPDVSFHVVGNCLPDDSSASLPANVVRHGFVPEARKRQLLLSSQLALNPMSSGSGANVKVLDYIAHGLPVVSTPFGLRGMPADIERCTVTAELGDFAAVVGSLIKDSGRLQQLRRATAAATSQLGWQACADRAAQAIDAWLADIDANSPRIAPVLVLNDYNPFLGYGGGATRTRGLYRAVSEWAPVVFIHLNPERQWTNQEVEPGIRAIGIPRTQAHVASDQAATSMYHISVQDIIAGMHAAHNPWLVAIYRGLRRLARCIVIEHCYLVDLPQLHGDRFVYSSQNHELLLKRSLIDGHPQRDTLLAFVEQAERRALSASAAIVAVSESDACSFAQSVSAMAPTIVIANGADVPCFQDLSEARQLPVPAPEHIPTEFTTVFLGSSHYPNVEAARYICEQLAPANPDIHFVFIGSVCDAIEARPNVHLLGRLPPEAKDAVMQSSRVALNPMLSGSGSNVKLADYLGNGLYVVSTEFGTRGYPDDIEPHVSVAVLNDFASAIRKALARTELHTAAPRAERRRLYEDKLSMAVAGQRFRQLLKSLEKPRKRILYVAYRYTSPSLGGAEHNMDQFIRALSQDGGFDVDVIATDITAMHSQHRFSEQYTRNTSYGVPVDLPNVRYAKFALTPPDAATLRRRLLAAWRAQIAIEQALCEQLDNESSVLAWGWASPEIIDGHTCRWIYTDAGLMLVNGGTLRLRGHADQRCTICILDAGQRAGITHIVQGDFDVAWQLPVGGRMQLLSTARALDSDPRPLAMLVHSVEVDGAPIDLDAPTLVDRLNTLPAETVINLLDAHAQRIRHEQNIRLDEMRGPWSQLLEKYLAEHIAEYDLVVAHNSVFRPAVVAMREAKRQGVASILVPHAHLDDDFYHFPDQLEAAQAASVVMVAPQVAVSYFERNKCRAMYLPAGCDASEAFTPSDIRAFRAIYPDQTPYFLVLGRKAGAKGYRKIIDAIDLLNQQGRTVRLVMIGPDDDGLPIDSSHVTYLGRQSREIVRGAIMHCQAICNMSSSESFGIVLLEAWLGGKPVIANRDCAAFNDLAKHEHNALLVNTTSLVPTLLRILDDPTLGPRLAEKGNEIAQLFDWKKICDSFIRVCHELSGASSHYQPMTRPTPKLH